MYLHKNNPIAMEKLEKMPKVSVDADVLGYLAREGECLQHVRACGADSQNTIFDQIIGFLNKDVINPGLAALFMQRGVCLSDSWTPDFFVNGPAEILKGVCKNEPAFLIAVGESLLGDSRFEAYELQVKHLMKPGKAMLAELSQKNSIPGSNFVHMVGSPMVSMQKIDTLRVIANAAVSMNDQSVMDLLDLNLFANPRNREDVAIAAYAAMLIGMRLPEFFRDKVAGQLLGCEDSALQLIAESFGRDGPVPEHLCHLIGNGALCSARERGDI